jgi:hypothetical protein
MQRKNIQPGLVPDAFKSLEVFARDWALPTENERWEKRATSAMEELLAYYDLVGPKMKAMAAHLDHFPMGTLPPQEQVLLNLAFMYIEVAIAVEFFKQPESPNGFPRHRWSVEAV